MPKAIGATGYDLQAWGATRARAVIRWFLVILLALVLFSALRPWLEKLGLGRLPGDFRFRLAGREWFIPLASSLVLSGLALLVSKLF